MGWVCRDGTGSLVEGSHHISEVSNMTGQLHVQKILQPLESIPREAQDEAREFSRRSDARKPPTHKSKPVQLCPLAIRRAGAAVRPVGWIGRTVRDGLCAQQVGEDVADEFVREVVNAPRGIHRVRSARQPRVWLLGALATTWKGGRLAKRRN